MLNISKLNQQYFSNKTVKMNKFYATKSDNKLNTAQEKEPKFVEVEHVLRFKQKFYNAVEAPISIIENLATHKMPQKCFEHNNNLTLYCENDRKTLCASCVYQNAHHRNHKISPLGPAVKKLREDAKVSEKELKAMILEVTGLVQYVNEGIADMEKQFPSLLQRVEKEYRNLHELLLDREKQHFNELKYLKQKTKYEHIVLSTQLRKVSLYIENKLTEYSKLQDEESLLLRRNCLQKLTDSTKIIQQQLGANFQIKQIYQFNYQIFEQVQNCILVKMPNMIKIKDITQKRKKDTREVTKINQYEKLNSIEKQNRNREISRSKSHSKTPKSHSKTPNSKGHKSQLKNPQINPNKSLGETKKTRNSPNLSPQKILFDEPLNQKPIQSRPGVRNKSPRQK